MSVNSRNRNTFYYFTYMRTIHEIRRQKRKNIRTYFGTKLSEYKYIFESLKELILIYQKKISINY